MQDASLTIDEDCSIDGPFIGDLSLMEDFSMRLKSSKEFRQEVEGKLLRQCRGTCVRQSVKLILHHLFDVNDLAGMNRHGTDGKKNFIGPIEIFVKEVALMLHKNAQVSDIEKAIASTLKVAANRRRSVTNIDANPSQPKKQRRTTLKGRSNIAHSS